MKEYFSLALENCFPESFCIQKEGVESKESLTRLAAMLPLKAFTARSITSATDVCSLEEDGVACPAGKQKISITG